MNRFVQIAAILVIAMLTAYPFAAGFSCSLNLGTAHRCCPMAQQLDTGGCNQCSRALPQMAILVADQEKPKTELAVPMPVGLIAMPRIETASAVSRIPVAKSSPPTFILDRVFRI